MQQKCGGYEADCQKWQANIDACQAENPNITWAELYERCRERLILIKLIDAKKDLPAQMHPDDAYAKQYENGQNGKIEMRYVLEAEPDVSLVYGFRHTITA